MTEVSSAGAFIETATEMAEGAILLLRFKVDGKAVKLEVEVVHHVPGRGLGVRFVNVGPDERQTIESIADSPA